MSSPVSLPIEVLRYIPSVLEAVEVAYDEFDYPNVNVSNSFDLDGDWEVDTVYGDNEAMKRWDYDPMSGEITEIKY